MKICKVCYLVPYLNWQHDVFPLSQKYLCTMRCELLSWLIHSVFVDIRCLLFLHLHQIVGKLFHIQVCIHLIDTTKHSVRFTPLCFQKTQPCFSCVLSVIECPSAPYTRWLWAVFMVMPVCYLSFCELRPHFFLIELNEGFSQVVSVKCGYN